MFFKKKEQQPPPKSIAVRIRDRRKTSDSVSYTRNPKQRAKRNQNSSDNSGGGLRKFWRKINFRRIFATLAVLLSLSGIAYYLVTQIDWRVQDVAFYGNTRLTQTQLYESLELNREDLIFNIKLDDVEAKLVDNFVEIKSVKATKEFPNRLVINIEEKIPEYILVNLTSLALVETAGEVLYAETHNADIPFPKTELDVLRGVIGIDHEIIENKIVVNLSEEELEDYNFDEITPEEKRAVLREIEEEITAKADEVFFDAEINEKNLPEVPVIFMYDTGEFFQKEKIRQSLKDFFRESIIGLNNFDEFSIQSYVWDGQIRLHASTDLGFDIIIGENVTFSRSVGLQLNDLEIVLAQERENLDKIEFIDLTTPKISVKYLDTSPPKSSIIKNNEIPEEVLEETSTEE